MVMVLGFGCNLGLRDVARGLAGWVRNTRNGDVELVAQGESEALDDLLSAVARGPRSANVAAVHREPVDSDASYPSPFAIET
jgi:acylphosphatase